MKRLVTIWLAILVLSGLAWATKTEKKPFVWISVTPRKLDLKTMPLIQSNKPTELKVKVESNCLHGPIMVTMTPLKYREGKGKFSPEMISVKTPETSGYVPMQKPVIISKVAEGPHDVILNFKVQPNFEAPAGKYEGTLTFTIMPP